MAAITPTTCRAARALLGWTQLDLAAAARVGAATVKGFEVGKTRPIDATLRAMRAALEEAGVLFIEPNGGGIGVRLRDHTDT